MPFLTHILIDESLDGVKLPLSRAKISLFGEKLHRLTKTIPEFRYFKKTMGASPGAWNLLICDDRKMRRLQKKFRRLDRTTDVLSFPSIEQLDLRPIFSKLPARERFLGDVVVSLPAVRRGALRGRRSLRDEFLEVLIHSHLHLLGLDHVVGKRVTASQARRMRDLQKALFLKLRDSIPSE
jgi:rRNA maturation RNase YbeY